LQSRNCGTLNFLAKQTLTCQDIFEALIFAPLFIKEKWNLKKGSNLLPFCEVKKQKSLPNGRLFFVAGIGLFVRLSADS